MASLILSSGFSTEKLLITPTSWQYSQCRHIIKLGSQLQLHSYLASRVEGPEGPPGHSCRQHFLTTPNISDDAVKAGKFFKKLHSRLASKVEGESSTPVPPYYSADPPQAVEAPAGSSLQGSQQGDLEAEQHQGHGDIKARLCFRDCTPAALSADQRGSALGC